MTLTFLGTQLDSSVEHELLADEHTLGFDAFIHFPKRSRIHPEFAGLDENYEPIYKDKILYTQPEETLVYHNLTEIHHRYGMGVFGMQIAFESDIQKHGCTRHIDEITSVVITMATKKHRGFWRKVK